MVKYNISRGKNLWNEKHKASVRITHFAKPIWTDTNTQIYGMHDVLPINSLPIQIIFSSFDDKLYFFNIPQIFIFYRDKNSDQT